MTPRELMRILPLHGWVLVRINGSHHVFKHAHRTRLVDVPLHHRDLSIGTLRGIEKDTGIKLR